MPDENAISLDNLAGGELKEQVNDALQRVIDNIADPNTNWKSKRKLSVTLSFSADERRNLADVTMEVKPTLAAAAPSKTRIIIDRDAQGKVVGAEYRPAPIGFQIPWRVAFALQADGWYLRSDIIWAKSNPMPESVRDRPTRAHEYIFLMSKSERYYYDHEAIKEKATGENLHELTCPGYKAPGQTEQKGNRRSDKQRGHSRSHAGFNDRWDHMTKAEQSAMGRNKRTVWTVATHPFPGAHFATFPPKLIEPCILAGSKHGDLILDPFSGAGTTGMVALRHGRRYMGIELNQKYVEMSEWRIREDMPLFNTDWWGCTK